jgi:hypothetical protein
MQPQRKLRSRMRAGARPSNEFDATTRPCRYASNAHGDLLIERHFGQSWIAAGARSSNSRSALCRWRKRAEVPSERHPSLRPFVDAAPPLALPPLLPFESPDVPGTPIPPHLRFADLRSKQTAHLQKQAGVPRNTTASGSSRGEAPLTWSRERCPGSVVPRPLQRVPRVDAREGTESLREPQSAPAKLGSESQVDKE